MFATTLVLQEMGLTVDLATDLEAALQWIEAADFAVVVCPGRADSSLIEFGRKVRYLARETRVFVFAERGFDPAGLSDLGIEVFRAPVDVNSLVSRLWPTAA
ncbi:MAG: hypothetical protein U0360_04150 [Dehalococcoidia bacterium]